jgi:hypothetical protein
MGKLFLRVDDRPSLRGELHAASRRLKMMFSSVEISVADLEQEDRQGREENGSVLPALPALPALPVLPVPLRLIDTP